jgi:hypothetical protein
MEFKAKVSEAKNWTATASEGKPGQSKVFEPSEEQMLKSRSQTNRRVFQGKAAEASIHEAEQHTAIVYTGYDAATGMAKLTDTKGNISYAAPITNGAIAKGEPIRARHGSLMTWDAMPHMPRQKPKAKIRAIPATAIEDYALLYRIREEREGDQPCVCGQSRWFYAEGRIKKKCFLLDIPSGMERYKVNGTDIYLNNNGFGFLSEAQAKQGSSAFDEILTIANGSPYRNIGGYQITNINSFLTATGARVDISASGVDLMIGVYKGFSKIYAKTIGFEIKQTTTFSIRSQFSEPPDTFKKFIAVGINKTPDTLLSVDPTPGTYDYYEPTSSLSWTVELDPGNYFFTLLATFAQFVGSTATDIPVSGFFEVDYTLPDTAEVDTFYAIASSTSDPVKLIEIRVDEPQRFYLTRTKNQALISLKTGINLDNEWIKISNFVVSGADLQVLESTNPATIPTTSSWQSTHIRSYAYNDPNGSDPCINNYKNSNEANIYKNSVTTCDLEQIIEGQELKDFLKTSDAEAQISINKLSSSEGFCLLGETVYKTIPIGVLPIDDSALSATQITAISPIYSDK